MESSRPQLLILADAPDALRPLFGISLLERLLRVVQRLGFRQAIILSNSPEEIAAHLTKPSWARAHVVLSFRPRRATAGLKLEEREDFLQSGRLKVEADDSAQHNQPHYDGDVTRSTQDRPDWPRAFAVARQCVATVHNELR